MRFLGRALVVGALLVVGARGAQAQEGDAAGETERFDRARAAFDEATEAFARGDFVGAREGFETALRLTNNPTLHFNLGLVAQRTGDLAAARQHYERFLRSNPDAEEAALAEERLREVMALESSVPEEEREPAPSEPEAQSGSHLVPALIVSGVGLLLSGGLAVGAGLSWSAANDAYATLEGRCAPACSPQEIDDSGGPGNVTAANVLLATSIAVAVVAAAITIPLLLTSGDGEGESLSLRLGPTSVAVVGSLP
jgi:tetratricopeptide (TPR) repeat protein